MRQQVKKTSPRLPLWQLSPSSAPPGSWTPSNEECWLMRNVTHREEASIRDPQEDRKPQLEPATLKPQHRVAVDISQCGGENSVALLILAALWFFIFGWKRRRKRCSLAVLRRFCFNKHCKTCPPQILIVAPPKLCSLEVCVCPVSTRRELGPPRSLLCWLLGTHELKSDPTKLLKFLQACRVHGQVSTKWQLL